MNDAELINALSAPPYALASVSAIIRALRPRLTATIREGETVAEVWLGDECIIRCETGSLFRAGESVTLNFGDGISRERLACQVLPAR
jgi:hypothetical protein